jgi:rfaE bifunctional protein kinase chain/domain
MRQDLFDLLEHAARTRVLVVGDAMLDHYVFGDAARLSPEAPVPVVRVERDEHRPGGAANTVLNVRALGAAAELVAVVGEDRYGERLQALLRDAGVDLGRLLKAADRPTTRKTRVIARRQQLVRVDRERADNLSAAEEDAFLKLFDAALAAADGVILSDYGKGAVTARVAAEVIRRTLAAGKVVTVDPKENHFPLYRGVTSLTPNHHEAAVGAGIRAADDPTLEKTGRKLLEMLAPASALVTCGERGMVLFHADPARSPPAPPPATPSSRSSPPPSRRAATIAPPPSWRTSPPASSSPRSAPPPPRPRKYAARSKPILRRMTRNCASGYRY